MRGPSRLRYGTQHRHAGQAAIEYLGVTVASALAVLAVAAGFPEVREAVAEALDRSVCTLTFGDDCFAEEREGEPAVPLGAVVDPEAPRPELGEAKGSTSSTMLAVNTRSTDDAQTCFAPATDCTSWLEGALETPLPDELNPCLIGRASEEDVARCESGLQPLLADVPLDRRERALKAIRGQLGALGCRGYDLSAGAEQCGLEDLLDVSRNTIDALAGLGPDRFERLAARLAVGVETIPEIQRPD